MKRARALLAVALTMPAMLHASQTWSADAVRGQDLYESRCGACHSIDANRVGPAHKGVVGRKAGSVADYDYSPAVKASGIIWTEQTLDRWLSDPEKTVPGQKMNYSVPDEQDRLDVIAYLKKVSVKP
jgi:cytochrome c